MSMNLNAKSQMTKFVSTPQDPQAGLKSSRIPTNRRLRGSQVATNNYALGEEGSSQKMTALVQLSVTNKHMDKGLEAYEQGHTPEELKKKRDACATHIEYHKDENGKLVGRKVIPLTGAGKDVLQMLTKERRDKEQQTGKQSSVTVAFNKFVDEYRLSDGDEDVRKSSEDESEEKAEEIMHDKPSAEDVEDALRLEREVGEIAQMELNKKNTFDAIAKRKEELKKEYTKMEKKEFDAKLTMFRFVKEPEKNLPQTKEEFEKEYPEILDQFNTYVKDHQITGQQITNGTIKAFQRQLKLLVEWTNQAKECNIKPATACAGLDGTQVEKKIEALQRNIALVQIIKWSNKKRCQEEVENLLKGSDLLPAKMDEVLGWAKKEGETASQDLPQDLKDLVTNTFVRVALFNLFYDELKKVEEKQGAGNGIDDAVKRCDYALNKSCLALKVKYPIKEYEYFDQQYFAWCREQQKIYEKTEPLKKTKAANDAVYKHVEHNAKKCQKLQKVFNHLILRATKNIFVFKTLLETNGEEEFKAKFEKELSPLPSSFKKTFLQQYDVWLNALPQAVKKDKALHEVTQALKKYGFMNTMKNTITTIGKRFFGGDKKMK